MTDLAAIKDELRALLAAAPDGPPWIRRWESLDVHGMRGDGVFTNQRNIDLAVAAVNALPALLADTPSVEPAGLAEAWRAAEAALPDGWLTLTLSKRAKSDIGPYSAAVHDGSEGAMAIRSGLAVGHGSTPEVALQRLAARLLPTQASDSPEKTMDQDVESCVRWAMTHYDPLDGDLSAKDVVGLSAFIARHLSERIEAEASDSPEKP